MSVKSPEPIDVQVGNRIKLLRQEAQMSQAELARCLGVTLQQVQKYEKGLNRLSAGRLSKIAEALGVSVSALLEDDWAGKNILDSSDEAPALELLSAPGALSLLKAYAQIDDGYQRRNIVALVERIASGPGKAD